MRKKEGWYVLWISEKVVSITNVQQLSHLCWNESQTINAGATFKCDKDIPSTTFSKVRHPSSLSIYSKDMSNPKTKVEKEEKMEDQLKEITELWNKFSASIGMIENNQYELCTAVQAQSSTEEKLETGIASALSIATPK